MARSRDWDTGSRKVREEEFAHSEEESALGHGWTDGKLEMTVKTFRTSALVFQRPLLLPHTTKTTLLLTSRVFVPRDT